MIDPLASSLFCSGLPCLVISVPRLTALVWQLDWSCEYVHAVAGELVAAQHEDISHLTAVLHGRLRGVQTTSSSGGGDHSHSHGGKVHDQQMAHPQQQEEAAAVVEISNGATLGLVELVTETKLNREWRATRDSNIARMPAAIFHVVASQYPCVFTHVCRMLAQQTSADQTKQLQQQQQHQKKRQMLLAQTVALVATCDDCPINHVAETLRLAINAMGTAAVRLDSNSLEAGLGARIYDTCVSIR